MLDLPEDDSLSPQTQSPGEQTAEEPKSKHERITAPADDPIEVELKKILEVPADATLKRDGDRRLNALHIRGVQEMNSHEVLDYFKTYDPASLEWVNDVSCNVVFDNVTAAIRALGDLATKIVVYKSPESVSPFTPPESSLLPIITSEDLDVPVPPGLWIQTKPHEKAEVLLIRLALLTDKKEPGAAKFSVFYQKHGNPHFGNKKQLVTKATAEKIQARISGQPVEEEQNETPAPENDEKMEELNDEVVDSVSEEEEDDTETLARRSGLRMKMRADEEEERVKSRAISPPVRKSIWERLDDRGSQKSSVFDRLGERSRVISRRKRQDSHEPYLTKRVSVFSRLLRADRNSNNQD